jgi:hypothetical protein
MLATEPEVLQNRPNPVDRRACRHHAVRRQRAAFSAAFLEIMLKPAEHGIEKRWNSSVAGIFLGIFLLTIKLETGPRRRRLAVGKRARRPTEVLIVPES